jgi:hypothetical protein
MDADEIKEAAERAREIGERGVGITMALVAVLVAITTMLGHRTHTDELVLQTRATDEWAYYQAKNNRSQMYAADAQLAALLSGKGPDRAAEFSKMAEDQKKGAEGVRREAERLEGETERAAHKATYFDLSEVLLEVSIVLCSITLLTFSSAFWKLSFVSTAIGIVLAGIAIFR